ncbi:PQQ-dependent sugar dehydrogenase [Streptomyces sp. ME19-01-6]|uniref:PQQ-dependent sugar dehydrogenase n=1 Tax=Streptomyces sp. ME19-01-6 TaxID=3028686 RepID=UPI0029BCA50D|nr:PQQ-dependent sugar dehydrogenase [Streptomyces sp. ME19-01-6]MDX3229531.1 PQQ-dependent sugar dehydrogenase [Streptomyces sp. ME19-01-6]
MRRPGVTPVLASAAALLLAAGCSSGDGGASPFDRPTRASGPTKPGSDGDSPSSGKPSSSPSSSAPAAPSKGTAKVVRTLTTKLDSPWGLATLPDGNLLVSSRDTGKIFKVDAASGQKTEVGSVPGVSPGGEGGLLGLALSPDYGANPMVYAYFTTASDNRIARMSYDDKRPTGSQLGAPDTVFKGIPKGAIHNGGRIAFGPDKMLYAGTGESGDRGLAQDLDSLGGKVLRMTPEGEPAHGNPQADSVVYSYGHRNVQGLAWDMDKRLWASEFGQDTWDELNLIRPGKNYGWPEAEGKAGKEGFVDPVEQWKPKDASPSGIAYAKGSIWMAGLRGERLWRIPLDGTRPAGKPQSFLDGKYGRLRSVVATDDGGLWVTTSNTDGRGKPGKEDDRILKLEIS